MSKLIWVAVQRLCSVVRGNPWKEILSLNSVTAITPFHFSLPPVILARVSPRVLTTTYGQSTYFMIVLF